MKITAEERQRQKQSIRDIWEKYYGANAQARLTTREPETRTSMEDSPAKRAWRTRKANMEKKGRA